MDIKVKEMLKGAGVDLEKTLARFMGNEALYCKFLLRFPSDPNYLDLEKALREKDLDLVERAAHTLKGVSANLGLDPVAAVMAEIVKSVRQGEADQLPILFEKAQREYMRFSDIIRKISGQ